MFLNIVRNAVETFGFLNLKLIFLAIDESIVHLILNRNRLAALLRN